VHFLVVGNLRCGFKKQETLIHRCRKRDLSSPLRVAQIWENICIDTDSALVGFLDSLASLNESLLYG